ncbi:MAG TPA: hypothetical protein VE732_03835 [Nitrososphaera sp.]|nr:hypothetical protein [Nitrososphaera sp.]
MELSPTIIILLVLFGGVTILFLLMLRDTIRHKGRWGINLEPIRCPRCGAQSPMVRKPSSLRQAAWGGWTCSKCGCEIDKWGTEMPQGKTSFSTPLTLETKDQIPREENYESSRTPLERVISEHEKEKQ